MRGPLPARPRVRPWRAPGPRRFAVSCAHGRRSPRGSPDVRCPWTILLCRGEEGVAMGRRERELSPGGGLAVRLAAELRALRREAGGPSYREMASRVYFSRSALAEAAAGRSLPSLPVLLAFVQACGGDPEPWEERWHVLRRLLDEGDAEVPPAPAWPAEEPVDGADPDC